MATYISLVNWTDQGIKTVKDSPSRLEASKALAKKYGVALVPFLLEGVGGVADLNQPDGIHPTGEGAEIVAKNVWNILKPVLEAESRRVGRGRVPGP